MTNAIVCRVLKGQAMRKASSSADGIGAMLSKHGMRKALSSADGNSVILSKHGTSGTFCTSFQGRLGRLLADTKKSNDSCLLLWELYVHSIIIPYIYGMIPYVYLVYMHDTVYIRHDDTCLETFERLKRLLEHPRGADSANCARSGGTLLEQVKGYLYLWTLTKGLTQPSVRPSPPSLPFGAVGFP